MVSFCLTKKLWGLLKSGYSVKVIRGYNTGIFMGKESSKKVSLYASLQKGILGLILVVTFSFLISTYFIADKEQKNYCKRESESVLKTLSSNIYSDIHKYIELSRIIMTEENLVEFLRADADSVDIGMINDARYGVMNVLNVTESVDGVMILIV